MQARYKTVLVVLVGLLSFPQITLAVWWKPYTWFQKPTSAVKVVQVASTTPATKTSVTTTTPKAAKKTTKAKPKIIPQAKTANQSAEIEELKKEVKGLKNQRANDQSATVVQSTTPSQFPVGCLSFTGFSSTTGQSCSTSVVSTGTAAEPTGVLSVTPSQKEETYKALIVKLIDKTKTEIEQFNKSLAESNSFTVMIQSYMAEYPNSSSLQQAGQDWLNNDPKFVSLVSKLMEIDTKILDKLALDTESSSVLQANEIAPLLQEYQSYFQEYETSGAQMKSLTKSFFDTRINLLNNEAEANRKEAERLRESTNQKRAQLNAVNQKIAALNAKYAQDTKNLEQNANKGLTSAGGADAVVNFGWLTGQQQEIDRKYQMDYNALQAEFQQIQYGN